MYPLNFGAFRKYLKRKRKKDSVIERNIRTIVDYQTYIKKDKDRELSESKKLDISQYVNKIEKEGKSAKGNLYVLMNYFRFLENQELYSHSAQLREKRTSITRKPFQLKNFVDVDLYIVNRLKSIGIINVKQMLSCGKSKEQRDRLASSLSIPEEAILELVNLSDLTRLGYVKRKLARLYYNAGIHSPIKVGEFEADSLYDYFVDFIKESNWDGMVPNRKDLEYNIKSARKLNEVVKY